MTPAALQLANSLGISQEHPDFPEEDWRAAVAAGDTREGYWDWVVLEMRFQNHAWLDVDETH